VPKANHYNIETWIDFVRGSLPPNQAALIENHLGQKCSACSRMAAFWGRVWRTAQDEVRFSPPVDLLRAVQASSALYLPRARVRVVFDSWREALPALLRRTTASGRHLIYQAGPVLLDLEIQQEDEGRMISVVGQLLSKSTEKKGLRDMPVRITLSDYTVAETSTNKFGEFHLEFAALGLEAARLKALIAWGDEIDIPLQLIKL
jgi:hypothetical protein